MAVPSSITDKSQEDNFIHVNMASRSGSDACSDADSSHTLSARCQELGKEETVDWLRQEFQQRVLDSKIYRRPLNVLLIGTAGVGKSSFLNSIIRAILNKWGNWVTSGAGGGKDRINITAYMRWINIFDPLSDDPDLLPSDQIPKDSDSDTEEEQDESFDEIAKKRARKREKRLQAVLRLAPRFIDLCGLPNENSYVNREVLRLLMYGHIPTSENILEAHSLGDEQGAAALRAKYPTGDDKLAIDRVVIINSANQECPKELIQAALAVAQPQTQNIDKDVTVKKAVPVFGLITKTDLIKTMGDDECAQYERMRNSLIKLLAIEGDETRLYECENYVYKYGEIPDLEHRRNDPAIDEKILRFLHDLCDRTRFIAYSKAKLEFKQAPEPIAPQLPVNPQYTQPTTSPPEIKGYIPNSYSPPIPQSAGLSAVALIILALAVYIGVLLHYNVLSNMITAHQIGIVPAAGLILAPILFLAYVIFYQNTNFQ